MPEWQPAHCSEPTYSAALGPTGPGSPPARLQWAPRAGAQEQSQAFAASSVPRLIGVSCNPITFARDARILADGGYSLESVRVVDQFTWSHHVELVASFTKR